MYAKAAKDFKHTTLTDIPPDEDRVGISILEEEPGLTGIYYRTKNGGLWPCRTVNQEKADHHKSVCEAWLAREGKHENKTKFQFDHIFTK